MPDVVLVHDAARPLIPAGTIPALLAALEHAAGAIPAVPVADTLKRVTDGLITATVPRDGLYRAQTPQAFRYKVLLAAHRAGTGMAATDDASLLEAIGESVAIVPGSDDNIKLTYAEDLARLERAMTAPLIPRVGTGFDVHVLEAGRPLMLCGVAVPHDKGLAGHSDADVGIHALCDAIYGALAEGDIGRHFPPSEAAWKDADSARFLAHAAGRIAARGGRLANADVTLICERPKIAPHAAAMAARLAEHPWRRRVTHLGQGDHDREARLHRPWRGHRRAGRRHRAAARLRRSRQMKYCAIAVLLLLAACASSSAPPAPIPPPMAETIPKPPVSAVPLIWQPGHWDWTGSSYVWVPASTSMRRGHSGTWMPPYWEKTNSGWVWRSAHWM